jgi:hypothetical protein
MVLVRGRGSGDGIDQWITLPVRGMQQDGQIVLDHFFVEKSPVFLVA